MTRRPLVAAIAATAIALGACSPSDPTPTPTAGEPTSAPAPTTTPAPPPTTTDPPPQAALEEMGVSAGHPAAAEVGVAVLEAGGNAVDAAIATAFAVSVVEPFASGLGGGGAALVVATDPDDGPPRAYDYREVVAGSGQVPSSNTGIPGFVAGMATLHEEHGTVPWEDLVEPAVRLACDGHPVSAMVAGLLRSSPGASVTSGLAHFADGGTPLAEGQMLVQEDLARTLEVLAEDGPAAFYTGRLVDELTAVPGIDADSLADYAVQESEPVTGTVGGLEVIAAPPALPGVALIQMLQVAESLGAADAEPDSADYVDALVQGSRVAEHTVGTELGDPRFVDVPVDDLIDAAGPAEAPVATASGEAPVGPAPARAAAPAAPAQPLSAGNTTHVSVVDADGLVVSMTNTIMHFWGSGQYVGGFFLNDHLVRFSIGSENNVPSPGRRPVTWSSPAVVADERGRPVLVLGSPGGELILSILGGVLARWIFHDQPLDEAVAAHRVHATGDVLRVESAPPEAVAQALRGLGYGFDVVGTSSYLFGSVQALEVDHDTGTLTGTADTRREAGYVVVPAP